ncbi:MAG: YihY/virulence factor BrkB family protein [Rhodoglobus sp.]
MAKQTWLTRLITRVQAWKPVRVFTQYSSGRGPLLAAGLSYQAIFAVFAAIWVAFAVAGFVIRSNPALLAGLFTVLSTSVPGLIDTGDGGVLSPQMLFQSSVLGWTGAIAAVGLIFTAISWLASGRDAVRVMFGLPSLPINFLLLKLRDLGLAIGFGIAILVSAVLTVLSTAALEAVLDWVGIDRDSGLATLAARVIGLLVVLLIDTIVLGIFFRTVSGIRIPLRYLVPGSIIGGVALGVLKALGSSLLGGATRNPLLASFAVILGLLIWFNLICQVILIAASWISVSAADDGVDLTHRRLRRTRVDGPGSDVGTAL